MLTLGRRISVVMLTLALAAGQAAVCQGWMPTAEARMACCRESRACPMHKGQSHDSGSERVLTQAQADSCCASSERESSSQSNPTSVVSITPIVLGTATVLPAVPPSLVLSDEWRTAVPIPTAPIPRHVLLSVFLV